MRRGKSSKAYNSPALQAFLPAAVVVLLLLLAVSENIPTGVSSARDDPFFGLPLVSGGRSPARNVSNYKSDLDCCNKCDCNADGTVCTCEDRHTRGCPIGCEDCYRERGRRYYCRDILDGCPESCDYEYDYDDGGHAAVQEDEVP